MVRSIPIAVYGAMLAATVAGQFLGIAVDALALGGRAVWLPLAFSVVLEAIVGARFGASRIGRPLTPTERAGLSLQYSAGLLGLSLPLAGWIVASKASPAQLAAAGASAPQLLPALALLLAAAAVCTAVRYALMTVFTAGAARLQGSAS